MFVQNSRIRRIACAIVILIAFSPGGYGTNEIDTSYENGIQDASKSSDGNPIRNTKRSTVNSTSVGLWFGPRLGKRRKSTEKAEIESQDLEAITDALNAGRWAFISIPRASRTDGFEKRQATQFTPRLGRELTEGIALYDVSSDRVNDQEQEVEVQIQPLLGLHPRFVPRLNRQQSSNEPSSLEVRELRNLLRKLMI